LKVLDAELNNISVILLWSVLLVGETEIGGESLTNFITISQNAVHLAGTMFELTTY
jgi:hypothetical protein